MIKPGQTIDRYKVEAVIGTGGTAVVYRVRHRQLNTAHALKVLSVTSASIRERMIREGQYQAALRHLNIVAVTDVLDLDGQPGLLMEYIEGPSLEDALRRYKLTLDDAETLFLGILSGVRHAHAQGLVHRDLKPANVLLARTQEGFVPKVTDFGLAKILQSEGTGTGSTRHGIAMGTPHYMAPEQIRDAKNVDQRADIFSLGCILYELCTAERTFPGDEALAIYNAIIGGEYVPPAQLVPDLPDRLDTAIRGSLALKPDRRIPDCGTLMAVIRGEREWTIRDEDATSPIPRRARTAERRDAPELPVAARNDDGTTPAPAPPRGEVPPGPHRGEPPAFSSGGLGVAVASEPGRSALDTNEPSLSQRLPTSRTPEPPRAEGVDATLGGDDSFERGPSPLKFVAIAVIGLGFLFVLGGGVIATAAMLVFGSDAPPPTARIVEPPTVEAAAPVEPAPAELAAAEPAPAAPPSKVAPATPVETPKSASPTRAAAAPKAEPKPAATASTAAPPTAPPAAPATATVKILSSPPTASVRIDGQAHTPTPLKLDLPVGRHEVELRSGDRTERFRIDVRAGDENKWCYGFDPAELFVGSCPR